MSSTTDTIDKKRAKIDELRRLLDDSSGSLSAERRAKLSGELQAVLQAWHQARKARYTQIEYSPKHEQATLKNSSKSKQPSRLPLESVFAGVASIRKNFTVFEESLANLRPWLLPPVVAPATLSKAVAECFHLACRVYRIMELEGRGYWRGLAPADREIAYKGYFLEPLSELQPCIERFKLFTKPSGFAPGVPKEVQADLAAFADEFACDFFPVQSSLRSFTAPSRTAPAACGKIVAENAHVAAFQFSHGIALVGLQAPSLTSKPVLDRTRELRSLFLREVGHLPSEVETRLRAELDLEMTIRAAHQNPPRQPLTLPDSGMSPSGVFAAEDLMILRVLANAKAALLVHQIPQQAGQLLREKGPLPAKQIGLIALSEAKVKERIPILIEKGLLDRPMGSNGKRTKHKGVGITDKGRLCLGE
jgi:hypothetical protein